MGGFLILASLFFSCEEPELYYNRQAAPPEEYPLDIQEIKEGQYLAGFVNICYQPEIPVSEIYAVLLFVDGVSVTSAVSGVPCYSLMLDTKQWPEGDHEISIGILEQNPPDLGLLNLVGAPSIIYTASVVFDQTPPTPVLLESVEWDEDAQAPRLTWQENEDLNFYAYIVYKDEFMSSGFVDTLYDQSVTSSIDYSHDEMIGISCQYKVIVWNRDQLVESNGITFKYPESFPLAVDQLLGVVPPIESADGSELFTLTTEGVTAVSLSTNIVARTYPMTTYPTGFALSKDGTKLYVLSSYSPKITVLNASTFEVISTAETDGFNGKNIICGRANRLYISTSWPFSGPLKILDAISLTEVGSLDIEAPDGIMAISSDNNTLYIADPSTAIYQPAKVYSIDISTDNPAIIHQRSASDEVRAIELSADDETLFVIHDYDYPAEMNLFVDCWDASTLVSDYTLAVPNQAFEMSINAQTLCVIYGDRYLNNWNPGGVYQYEISTGQLIHDWKLKQAPYECFIDSGNQNLYVFGINSWVISLNNN
jgi:DNA-binding beta-propeller fold protein YncE